MTKILFQLVAGFLLFSEAFGKSSIKKSQENKSNEQDSSNHDQSAQGCLSNTDCVSGYECLNGKCQQIQAIGCNSSGNSNCPGSQACSGLAFYDPNIPLPFTYARLDPPSQVISGTCTQKCTLDIWAASQGFISSQCKFNANSAPHCYQGTCVKCTSNSDCQLICNQIAALIQFPPVLPSFCDAGGQCVCDFYAP